MPKVVDNYVLERKIGSGQFGEVFKGFNKVNGQDIAVKVVKRELLKGKFHQLFENEIKVLKQCSNENIIRLYDIKKTANNIYLMMEFCNEGDLLQYMKEKGKLTEEEAIDFLIQILNAFKTLVKNKIMHRDLKLANILKSDGKIKIADFGFSKLMGNETHADTMLGSPLNMAPEVLNGKEYTNKADIWSIGTVFYELLFGTPPFTANNMIELIKKIQTRPIDINKKVNNISPVVEEVLRKMLVVDPNKRIDWKDLFEHPVNFVLEEKMKADLQNTMQGGDLNYNMSRFYIKNNMVINHPTEIEKKKEINDYTIQVAKEGQKQQSKYTGEFYKRPQEEAQELAYQSQNSQQSQQQSVNNVQNDDDVMTSEETKKEIEIREKKKNANRILHERNIYVFLASVAEDAINNGQLYYSEVVGFFLVKKLIQMIEFLRTILLDKVNALNLDYWEPFTQTKDFKDITLYIQKEYDVFRVYFDSMYEKIINSSRFKQLQLPQEVKNCVNLNLNQSFSGPFKFVLKEYSKELIQHITSLEKQRRQSLNQLKTEQPNDTQKQLWIHANRILDCLRLEDIFQFEKKGQRFNFKLYYEEVNYMEIEALIGKVEEKLSIVMKN